MGGLNLALLIIQILSAIAIICLVLLQHGKGADMGAAFGSGSAGSVFGSSGSANFLSRMTAGAATLFFVTTLGMTFIGYKSLNKESGSVLDGSSLVTEVQSVGDKKEENVDASATTEGTSDKLSDQIPTN